MEVTRLIYPKDEVIYMFAVSSLKKDCLQTIFWFSELYYSGFQYDALYAIYFTYFNFYSLQQPYLIDYIYNHIDSWSKDDNIEHFIFIIFKFQLCKYNFDTFYLFHQNSNTITKSFSFCKGRIPKRFSHLSKIQYNIVKSIEGKNINNVLYFIQNHYDITKEMFYNNFHFHSYAPKAAQYLETLSPVERIRLASNVAPETAAFNDIYTWQGGIDFGKTVNSSEYADGLQTRELRTRAVALIDQFFTTRFENLSLVEDFPTCIEIWVKGFFGRSFIINYMKFVVSIYPNIIYPTKK